MYKLKLPGVFAGRLTTHSTHGTRSSGMCASFLNRCLVAYTALVHHAQSSRDSLPAISCSHSEFYNTLRSLVTAIELVGSVIHLRTLIRIQELSWRQACLLNFLCNQALQYDPTTPVWKYLDADMWCTKLLYVSGMKLRKVDDLRVIALKVLSVLACGSDGSKVLVMTVDICMNQLRFLSLLGSTLYQDS